MIYKKKKLVHAAVWSKCITHIDTCNVKAWFVERHFFKGPSGVSLLVFLFSFLFLSFFCCMLFKPEKNNSSRRENRVTIDSRIDAVSVRFVNKNIAIQNWARNHMVLLKIFVQTRLTCRYFDLLLRRYGTIHIAWMKSENPVFHTERIFKEVYYKESIDTGRA